MPCLYSSSDLLPFHFLFISPYYLPSSNLIIDSEIPRIGGEQIDFQAISCTFIITVSWYLVIHRILFKNFTSTRAGFGSNVWGTHHVIT